MSKGPENPLPKFEKQPAGRINPIDKHVGHRLRQRRALLGISQEKLGEAVGLTFQQIQKYERGSNRIGASRLYQFSCILEVPVSYFFDDIADKLKTPEGQLAGLSDGGQDSIDMDPMSRQETLTLVRAYYQISNPAIRKRLLELARTIGGEETSD
jgi:transcriptional regulator with XRE-family HTH domain